ncbi:MAG: hypothetical protein H7249_05570 [Chitinophagaceae bacterium]|nr:hypothetical protein [Oligoflexus sp.]
MQSNIAITAAALASSFGCSVEELRANLASGHRGLSFTHRFSDKIASPLGEIPWETLGIPIYDRSDSDSLLIKGCQRVFNQLNDTSNILNRFSPSRIGLFIGTTTCGISGFFDVARQLKSTGLALSSLLKADMQQAWVGRTLADQFSIRGPVYTFSSSCAASAQAFVMAHDAVHIGWIDAAIVLGVDILNPVTLHGFDSLQLLDSNFCEPFTPDRGGINLSEAIVAMVLERESDSAAGTRVRSYAALTEGHHMTQPAPDGAGMKLCMEKALRNAALEPHEIGTINPHGTGTLANDEGESLAITQIFGDIALVHPTKRFTGHTLGASGALELLISSLELEKSESGSFKNSYALKNSFGFGGSNISIILQRGGL